MSSPTLQNQPLDSNTADFLKQAAAAKFDFHKVSVKAAGDEKLKRSINNAVMRQYTARQLRLLDLFARLTGRILRRAWIEVSDVGGPDMAPPTSQPSSRPG